MTSVSFQHIPLFSQALPYFPGLQDSSALELAISLKSSPKHWRMVFRSQGLRVGCAHCYWDVIASRQCMFLHYSPPPPTHTHSIYLSIISTSIYLPIYVYTTRNRADNFAFNSAKGLFNLFFFPILYFVLR